MQHQQRIAGRKKSSVDHGVSALARLQQQVVHEGDVQGLVVDTDGVTSSSAAAIFSSRTTASTLETEV